MICAAEDPRPSDSGGLRLVSAQELARRLGIGRRTLASRLAAGQLPSPVRVNGRLFWGSDAVDAYLFRLLQPDDGTQPA